ncbi:hypothetical protein FISHEDRAFT_75268 [Fistulina hepatica ATCC 64428]|uniref:RRM Nup35-type domain-containing protein n=1 Tax=Fistulina hepatica ATCC 64428 TaxID=1128425 RepID=A0A0D7A7X7_9AGAR|nr:hypothetical protein FISHEDRAFT_75268 [Fistulina hepatica ATCC 64428]
MSTNARTLTGSPYASHDPSNFPSSVSQTSHAPHFAAAGPSDLRYSQWGNSAMATSLNNPSTIPETRTYTPGYIVSPPANAPQQASPAAEPPIIPTKAKTSHPLTRTTALEFGTESIFQSSRSRQLADDEAPPLRSAYDIPNQIYDQGHNPSLMSSPPKPAFDNSSNIREETGPVPAPQPALRVIVFGFPPGQAQVAADYFKSLGQCSEPDFSLGLQNAFRIGYVHPTDAMRAVSKNGEVFFGQWIVGAKWEDQLQADAVLSSLAGGRALRNGGVPATFVNSGSMSFGDAMNVDSPNHTGTPQTRSSAPGTPIRLGPSSSIYKKPSNSTPASASRGIWSSASGKKPETPVAAQPSPGKGVVAQVSDLLFGW